MNQQPLFTPSSAMDAMKSMVAGTASPTTTQVGFATPGQPLVANAQPQTGGAKTSRVSRTSSRMELDVEKRLQPSRESKTKTELVKKQTAELEKKLRTERKLQRIQDKERTERYKSLTADLLGALRETPSAARVIDEREAYIAKQREEAAKFKSFANDMTKALNGAKREKLAEIREESRSSDRPLHLRRHSKRSASMSS